MPIMLSAAPGQGCSGLPCFWRCRQVGDGDGTELDAGGCRAGFNLICVVETGAACGEKAEVPVHRVLIEGNQQVEAVTHVGDGVGPVRIIRKVWPPRMIDW